MEKADFVRLLDWIDGALDCLAVPQAAALEVGYIPMRTVRIRHDRGSGFDHDPAMARRGIAFQSRNTAGHFD